MPQSFILITRPQNTANKLALKLQELGLKPLVDSVIAIEKLAFSPKPITPQACIVTSQNAAFTLPIYQVPLHTPIYVVGHATAAAVKEHGYEHIIIGKGTAASLLPMLQADLEPSRGIVVHFCGADILFDFTPPLLSEGYLCYNEVVYRSVAAKRLQAQTIRAIQNHQILAMLFYSSKTARCFTELALELENHLMDVTAICLSHDVAAALQLSFKKIVIAKYPTEDALLDTLRDEVGDDRRD
jgi:uroporphyrinogen-III synthase